jgi:hypothetical protein
MELTPRTSECFEFYYLNGTPNELTFHFSEHIARAAGAVMDACWRADNTVQGDEFAWGNGNIAVHIVKAGLF